MKVTFPVISLTIIIGNSTREVVRLRKVEKFGKKFQQMEKTPCDNCGYPVYSFKIFHDRSYKCKKCRYEEKQAEREKKRPLKELEKERRLEIAKEYLQKKGILTDYEKPLKLVESNLYKPFYFESSLEILAALELLRKGFQIKHQVKVGQWRVDFVIPSIKVVLEIDGTLYHTKDKKEKEQHRDSVIIASLGPEWEVIRIKEDMLKKNVQRLIPAMKTVLTKRRKLREGYGVIPNWYNDIHK